MNKENIKNLYDEVSKDGYDLEELKNLDTETLLDEDREVWVKYKWHKQKLTKSNKEAVEGLSEDLCNVCRDMVHSKYAIQKQEKKTGSVETVV